MKKPLDLPALSETYSVRDYILPIVAILMSAATIILNLNTFTFLKMATAALGIVGGIMFFTQNKYFDSALWLWVTLQTVVIVNTQVMDIDGSGVIESERNVFDATQTVHLIMEFGANGFSIGFNLLTIAFYYLLKRLRLSTMTANPVVLTKFSQKNKLVHDRLVGEVVRRVKIENDSRWLLVELKNGFEFNDIFYQYVLIKPKDNSVFTISEKKVISFVRGVQFPDEVGGDQKELSEYPMIDWAYVKIHSKYSKEES